MQPGLVADQILLNTGANDGTFNQVSGPVTNVSTIEQQLAFDLNRFHFVDVNADGATDIVFVHGRGAASLQVFLNSGSATFTPAYTIPNITVEVRDGTTLGSVDLQGRVRILDLNGDHLPDLYWVTGCGVDAQPDKVAKWHFVCVLCVVTHKKDV